MRIASKCVASWLVVAGLMCGPVIYGQEVGAPPTPPKPKTVEITPTNIQAHVGDKIKFTAVAKDDTGKTIDVKPMIWIGLAPDIAGADADGTVVFRAAGQVTVGAVVAGQTGFAPGAGGAPAPAA